MDRCADAYGELFAELAAARPDVLPARDFDRWELPPGLRRGLRTYLPEPVKNAMREWRERLAAR